MANLSNTFTGNYEHMVQINSASFTPREVQIQREIFLIVQGAKQVLSAEEIYDFVLLDIESDSFDADARLAASCRRHCQTLPTVAEGRLGQPRQIRPRHSQRVSATGTSDEK